MNSSFSVKTQSTGGSFAQIAVIARRRADWPAQVRFGARNRDFRDR
jgi:hypothetical protein